MNLKNKIAQSTIEFTFAMVVVSLLIYGLIQVFRWVGMDYAQTSFKQEQSNVFIHPDGCELDSSCYSMNVESYDRKQRLNAFTRKF